MTHAGSGRDLAVSTLDLPDELEIKRTNRLTSTWT